MKTDESMLIASEQILVWANRIAAKKSQAAVTNSLNGVKDFDEIHARKS